MAIWIKFGGIDSTDETADDTDVGAGTVIGCGSVVGVGEAMREKMG
jgi:hypothetical protein